MKEITRVRKQGPWIREPEKHPFKGGGFRKSEKQRSGKGKKRKNRKNVKHRRNLWWTKRSEQFANFLVSERKDEDLEEKKAEKGIRVPGRNNFWEDLKDGSSFS